MKRILAILLLSVAGCATVQQENIPTPLLDWADANIYRVVNQGGSGSGFWVGNIFITACHVVKDGGPISIAQNGINPISMEVLTCNTTNDVATLRATHEKHAETPVFWADEGEIVYGAGYPLGGRLVITKGHYQGLEPSALDAYPEGAYLTSVPTINGDSGSPILGIAGENVYIAGIRIAVRLHQIFGYAGPVQMPISHLAATSGPRSIKNEIETAKKIIRGEILLR